MTDAVQIILILCATYLANSLITKRNTGKKQKGGDSNA